MKLKVMYAGRVFESIDADANSEFVVKEGWTGNKEDSRDAFDIGLIWFDIGVTLGPIVQQLGHFVTAGHVQDQPLQLGNVGDTVSDNLCSMCWYD